MTDITAPAPSTRSPAHLLLAPFRAIGSFMVTVAEASPKMRALRRLSETSDETLVARGTTREAEIRRIIGGAMGA